MCGIVACSGESPVAPLLVEALERLEYRGYDSAGIAVPAVDGRVEALRSIERVDDLGRRAAGWAPAVSATTGLGHTRWATHGEVSVVNAHPHRDCSGRVAVVHNGVLEDVTELRRALTDAGHMIVSHTDSELIAHLIEEAMSEDTDLAGAVERVVGGLRGSWALVVLDARTDELVATCHGSPLVVAEGPEGVFAASDIGAIAPWVEWYHVLDDGDVVRLRAGLPWHRGGVPVAPPPAVACSVGVADLSLGLYPDFMAKEIEQQPDVAERLITTWSGSILHGLWPSFSLPVPRHVTVVGCGTSLNAGRVVADLLARLGSIPFAAVEASELTSTATVPGSLALVLSQSGETADVLTALDVLHGRGHAVVALTNNPHSALARRAEAVMMCHAGPEIGVAATKTFVAQVLGGTCVVLSLLGCSGAVEQQRAQRLVRDLDRVPDALAQAIGASRRTVPQVLEGLTKASGYVFLGRGPGRIYADEGALKLKELTYRWAESHAAGELKHGPLALVEHGTPVIVVDDGSARMHATIAEVSARGAEITSIGGHGTSVPALGSPLAGALDTTVDWLGPLASVVALQIIARELAVALGRDVDKPRNLAKSVTVE